MIRLVTGQGAVTKCLLATLFSTGFKIPVPDIVVKRHYATAPMFLGGL